MRRNARRSLAAVVAGPIVASGLFLATVPAHAWATVGDATCSNSMAMPQTKAGTGAPSTMTRAGQVTAGAPVASSDGAMATGCSAVNHG